MFGLGFLLFVAGGFATLVGVIMAIVGLVESNKKKLKTGAIVLVSGALGLMVSFTLCTSGGL